MPGSAQRTLSGTYQIPHLQGLDNRLSSSIEPPLSMILILASPDGTLGRFSRIDQF
jgi:hypothetical protein